MQSMLTPQQFVARWRRAELKERSGAQAHFMDLCRLVGHSTPAEADPSGQGFVFEAGATKQGGGRGWADVWKKGYFAWEYKGKGKDLGKAYQQLLKYRESLQNPPLLVVSDMEQIQIHTNFTNTVKQVITLCLEDLLTPEGREQLRAVFFEPEVFRIPQTTEAVTQEAAAEFARLAELLRKYGADPQQAARFLIRLLFCLFAEDIGLLPRDLFTHLIERVRGRSSAFAAQLRQLFQAMTAGGWFGAEEILRFDGRLFDDDCVLELDSEGLAVLDRVSTLDWSNIEPAIFGTLFERSLDPGKRSQLGAHYTSKEDILLIVEPVLMAPLRRRWEAVREEAGELVRRREAAKTARTRNNRQRDLTALLTGFAQEVASVQVLDPACGSGNFLYVALKQLLDLEKQVVNLADDLGVGRFFPSVSPDQLHGIEINAYAHELAQATIWIGYIQWMDQNGFGQPAEPILKPLETILQMDAILAYDETGRVVEPGWPEADVVVGNPPFLGGKRLRTELGDPYVDTLFGLYEGQVPHEADLVCYWFERARALIEAGKLKRAGLLATQGIRGGANRKVLERIKETGDIFWAQSDRDWILEGASVHVSMVGFDKGVEQSRTLDDKTVRTINADLTGSIDLTTAQRLGENFNIAFMGDTKGGSFDIPADVAVKMLDAPLNPNGRPNGDVLRLWINGLDITRRSRGMWIIDFGVNMPEDEAALYEVPFEYVLRHVKPKRLTNKRAAYRERWWIHIEPRPAMRAAIAPLRRYIVTPRVSKYRLFVWMDPETLADSATIAIAREDDYFFGVLHSKVHELWARRKGSQLREAESGFRYTPTTTFETFPFPWSPGEEPAGEARVEAIAEAARELVEKRGRWLNPEGATEAELKRRTLTNLYNQRPMWLELVHRRLDCAVLDAYGWADDLMEEEILERLLALNLERAGG